MESIIGTASRILLASDGESGLRCAIALDDVKRGPALGGVRWKRYPSETEAIVEARRLGAAMTLKNALAELPFGGGKSVIFSPWEQEGPRRDAVLDAFAAAVADLGGAYVPGVDMGTGCGDLARIAQTYPDAACSDEDPSPWTALGVLCAVRAAAAAVLDRDLPELTVLVQGAGHVGADLAQRLAEAGARVAIADIDPFRAAAVAGEVGGETVAPDAVLTHACDVLAPCATARVIGPAAVARLACRVIAGAANDQLADPEVAVQLARREITYVPDFLVNAGGVIHIHGRRSGWSDDRLTTEVERIGERAHDVLEIASATGSTPAAVAEQLARDNLRAPVLR